MGLEQAFVVGGGYKYCQFGEGVCFLRIPADCSARPILTGWFSEFGELADNPGAGPVAYATARIVRRFDLRPVSHYRPAPCCVSFARSGWTRPGYGPSARRNWPD